MTYQRGIGFIKGRPMSTARRKLELFAAVSPVSSLDQTEVAEVALAIRQEFDAAVDAEMQRVTGLFHQIEAYSQTLQILPPTALYQSLVEASSSMLETYKLFESDATEIAELGFPGFKAHVLQHVEDAKHTHSIALNIATGGSSTTAAQGKIIAEYNKQLTKITDETNRHRRDSAERNIASWGSYLRQTK